MNNEETIDISARKYSRKLENAEKVSTKYPSFNKPIHIFVTYIRLTNNYWSQQSEDVAGDASIWKSPRTPRNTVKISRGLQLYCSAVNIYLSLLFSHSGIVRFTKICVIQVLT